MIYNLKWLKCGDKHNVQLVNQKEQEINFLLKVL